MRIFRHDGRFLRQMQRADKGLTQLRQEMQRPSQKRHMPPNRFAAGQSGNRLIHDSLKNRSRQILPCRAFVNQRLNIALGKHAATRRNGVQLVIIPCQLIQPRRVRFQQRRHLVDERARTTGAHAVHALLQTAGEINNLRVLSAQFNGDIGLRCRLLQRFRHRDDFLHETNVQCLRQRDRARTCHLYLHAACPKLCPSLAQHFRQRFLGVGAVAAIFAPDHLAVFIQQHQLDGGRSNVNTCIIRIRGIHAHLPYLIHSVRRFCHHQIRHDHCLVI